MAYLSIDMPNIACLSTILYTDEYILPCLDSPVVYIVTEILIILCMYHIFMHGLLSIQYGCQGIWVFMAFVRERIFWPENIGVCFVCTIYNIPTNINDKR